MPRLPTPFRPNTPPQSAPESALSPIGGYILAGGQSSRMGRDKALLKLAGKALIVHAVEKLTRICTQVHILSANPKLAAYAPLVPDRYPNSGPMAGMEAALAHSPFDWNLFLAVDMPFLPPAFIDAWVRHGLQASKIRDRGARLRMFTVEGKPQPGFCLLHREVGPFLTASLESGWRKLYPTFQAAGNELALKRGFPPDAGLWIAPMTGIPPSLNPGQGKASLPITPAQQAARSLWFANLNTPEDLQEAENHLDALDPDLAEKVTPHPLSSFF